MNAKEFAKEFINDLDPKEVASTSQFVFNSDVYKDDPNLKVLNQELKKIGYQLIIAEPDTNEVDQQWSLIKI